MKKQPKKKPAPRNGKVAEVVKVWLPSHWRETAAPNGWISACTVRVYPSDVRAELHIPKTRSRR